MHYETSSTIGSISTRTGVSIPQGDDGAASAPQIGKLHDVGDAFSKSVTMANNFTLYSANGEVARKVSLLTECVYDVPHLSRLYDMQLAAPDLINKIFAPSLGIPANHSIVDDGTYGGASRLTELRNMVHQAIFGAALAARNGNGEAYPSFLSVEQITDPSHPLRLERPSDEPAVTVIYNGPEIISQPGDDPKILGALFGTISKLERTDGSFILLPGSSTQMEDSGRDLPSLEAMLSYQIRNAGPPVEPASISHVPILRSGRYVIDISEGCSTAAFVAHFESIWGPLHRQALACPRAVLPAGRNDVDDSCVENRIGYQANERSRGPNVRWHLVTVDRELPYLVLSSIPGMPLKPGQELLCDKGTAWFRQHSRLLWPRVFGELLKQKGCSEREMPTYYPGALLSEFPRRLVCSGCGEGVQPHMTKLYVCDACTLYFHQTCLQEKKSNGIKSYYCHACIAIAEKVFGIGSNNTGKIGGLPGSPTSSLAQTTAALTLIRGDEAPYVALKPCKACSALMHANVNVQCRLIDKHSDPDRGATTSDSQIQTLTKSLTVAVDGIVAAEERSATLAQKAVDVQASAMFPDITEANLQEAVEQWKDVRLKARAQSNPPLPVSLLVPHIPLVETHSVEAAAVTVYRARSAVSAAAAAAAATSADDEDSEPAHYTDDEDDEEDDGSALAESDDGGPSNRRHRRGRPPVTHVSIEGGPQSVAKDLLGEDFEPPAGVAVMIEGNSSIADANNKARDLRPWPRGVSWNGKRLTWSVRFWGPGGLRLLSTSLPARKHGGVVEAFRKAVTLRTRSYGYVLARIAGETLSELGGNLPAAVWEQSHWSATAPDGSCETFEAQGEQEVRSALRQAYLWLREHGDACALSLDMSVVDNVVNKPRPTPIPEGPAHEMATANSAIGRTKRSRMGEDYVLPPPTEVQPCGQNLSLPSPYYSQDLAVMTAEMEAEVRQLPDNDKIKWYRQKRGFNASIFGQSKWFSAYSRGVHNAYSMAVAWLERKKAEAAAATSGRPLETPVSYQDDLSRCCSGGSTVHGRRTRSNRLDYRNSPLENSNEYYDSGYARNSVERNKRPVLPRPERPLNPGVRQMMEIADEVQHNGKWDSDDSTPDANDEARRLPKISNICWVPQKQAFSVFYTKDPAHSSKTTKAFNPQYYGGVKRSFRQALLFAFAMQLRMHPSWRSKYSDDTKQEGETKAMCDDDYVASRTCTP